MLDYVAKSPEMDELVKRQSGDLVGEIFEDVFNDFGVRKSKDGFIFNDWFNSVILKKPSHKPDSNTDIIPPADE